MVSSIYDIDKGMKILIVDDFATMRKIVRTLFERIGFSKLSEALSIKESAFLIVLLASCKSAFLHIVSVLRITAVNSNFFIVDNFMM